MKLLYIFIFYSYSTVASELRAITHNIDGEAICKDSKCLAVSSGGKRAFYISIFNEIMNNTGNEIPIKIYPFKRGWKYVTSKKNIIFFPVQRIHSREERVQWVGPIATSTDYFFGKRNNYIYPLTNKRLTKMSICILNGSSHETILLEKGFQNLHRVNYFSICLKLLMHNRVEFILNSNDNIINMLESNNIQKEDIYNTNIILTSKAIYIAFSNNINRDLVVKWNKVLKKIKQSGRYYKLYNKYIKNF